MVFVRTVAWEIQRLAHGVPGAYVALEHIVLHCEAQAYPLNKGAGHYFDLITALGLSGTEISTLYADKCNKQLSRFLLLLVAIERGIYPVSKALEMARDQFSEVNISNGIWRELEELILGKA